MKKDFRFTPLNDRMALMPPAVSGAGGRRDLYLACLVPFGYGLSKAEALQSLATFNARCHPPFSDRDLASAVESASKSGIAPDFYLKKGGEDGRTSRHWSAPQSHLDAAVMARAQERTLAEEDLEKAKKRLLWPTFARPTDKDLETVAELRHLPLEAVHLARAAGFLWSAQVDSVACLTITEGKHFAQAMRLDGKPFDLPGAPRKKTLPGSLSKGFVGWSKLGDKSCPTLIVEGVAGLLEGIAAVWAADSPAGVLAAISCGSRFANSTFPMPDLTGRRFRIVPDHDDGHTGFKSAAAWQAELEAMGATVDAFGLPPGCKDLGPVVADHVAHADYLNQLFTF